MLREPAKEYTRFAAGLSFIAALPPAEATRLLEERGRLLKEEVERKRSGMDAVMEKGVPRLFLVETEHELVLREAELEWVRGLVRGIRAGTLGGLDEWASFHPESVASGREEGG